MYIFFYEEFEKVNVTSATVPVVRTVDYSIEMAIGEVSRPA